MFKDRYGNPLFDENSITVFDTDLNYDSELFEDTLGLKLKDFDRGQFNAAYEVDVGGGADWPAVAYEIADKAQYLAPVVAVLFYGEKVEKSLRAWGRLAAELVALIPKRGFTDMNGAGILALNAVFEATETTNVRLVAWTWGDDVNAPYVEGEKNLTAFEVIAKLNEIAPRDQQFGIGLHSRPTFLFKFDADGETFLVSVKGKKAEVMRAPQ
ncbi:MAG: hypothetical protein AAF871_13160 [Pseudomonadota bacterium]